MYKEETLLAHKTERWRSSSQLQVWLDPEPPLVMSPTFFISEFCFLSMSSYMLPAHHTHQKASFSLIVQLVQLPDSAIMWDTFMLRNYP